MNQEQFNKTIQKFETTNINIHYLLVYQDGDIMSHAFKGRTGPSDIRSLSKTVLALIAGTIKDFSVEEKVWPIIKPLVNLDNQENLKFLEQLKVKHLLNHTMGYDEILLMRGDLLDKDPFTLLDYVINYPIKHEPGSHYLYSNAGYYVLGVFLQEKVGMDLYQYAVENFFSPLQIGNPKWEYYGNYLAGATRLWLMPEDLLKIGLLILNKGGDLIEESWIDYLSEMTILTPDVDIESNEYFRRYAYASGLWLSKKDIIFGHGTDGQTLAIIPNKKAIVITLSHQKGVRGLEEIVNQIISDL